MENWKQNPRVFWTLGSPPSVWLLAFFIIPARVFSSSCRSATRPWSTARCRSTEYDYLTGITNYIRAFDPLYLAIMWKSVWISALATALCLVLAYPIAFGICFAPDRWKPLLLLLVVLPFWINLLIRTYALIAVFRTQGYVNKVLGFVGLGPYEMLYNNFAVIFGLVYVYMPFMVLPLYATIERLDKSFLEASLDLGASQFQTFLRVTVPLTMPGIVSGIILVFIPCLGTFLTPDLLGGANAIMIGNVIERQFKAANDWPFGAALSFLLMYATFGALAAPLPLHACAAREWTSDGRRQCSSRGRGLSTMAAAPGSRLLFAAIFFLLYAPIITLVAFSFNTDKRGVVWRGFTLDNYVKAWNNDSLIEALTNSLVIAFIATISGHHARRACRTSPVALPLSPEGRL